MANQVERQITLEGQRNMTVKWTGVLDTSDFTLTPALALSDCRYNFPGSRLVGFRVDEVTWTASNGLVLQLTWNAALPQLIAAMAGQGMICAEESGGYSPDRNRAGYDGSLNLSSAGYPAGTTANFTVSVELVKRYA